MEDSVCCSSAKKFRVINMVFKNESGVALIIAILVLSLIHI